MNQKAIKVVMHLVQAMDQEERKEREASDGSGGMEGAGSKQWIREQPMDHGRIKEK